MLIKIYAHKCSITGVQNLFFSASKELPDDFSPDFIFIKEIDIGMPEEVEDFDWTIFQSRKADEISATIAELQLELDGLDVEVGDSADITSIDVKKDLH